MRIAIDAMGGDFGPATIVAGSVDGARQFETPITLTGRKSVIDHELANLDVAGLDIAIIDTPEAVEMDESPSQAVRKKPRSSINLALQEIRAGSAHGMVSAGNSGAVLASAFMTLGRIPGIDRPALLTRLPSPRTDALLLDLGAVVEPQPHNIVEFAYMAKIYREKTTGRRNPSIGLLSNGEEASKGNTLTVQAHELLASEKALNFHGNVEGKDLLAGVVDIIVTDGFSGNIALKTIEGVISSYNELIQQQLAVSRFRKRLAAKVVHEALENAHTIMDYAEIGGAPLLGVNGAVVVCHGRSSRRAMCNAVGMSLALAKLGVVSEIAAAMAARNANPPDENPAGSAINPS
jgi:glycerol-3-phosphate acyltransferase PlsX